MTFIEHLSELRKRLLAVVGAVVCASVVAYVFVDGLVALLSAPAQGVQFVYLTPPELFLAYLRISLLAGLLATMPFTLAQVWLFVRPGLTRRERRVTRFTLAGGSVFFVLGCAFSAVVILPMALRFFLQFASETIEPMISFGNYVGFVASLLVAFGVAFELPMIVVALARLDLVSVESLAAARPYIVVGVLALAAFLTPPDVVSQILLAVPLMALFELSLLFARITRRRARQEE